MAVAVEASGTQTATVGTEHTLATIAGPGVYVVKVDTANLAAHYHSALSVGLPALPMMSGTRAPPASPSWMHGRPFCAAYSMPRSILVTPTRPPASQPRALPRRPPIDRGTASRRGA